MGVESRLAGRSSLNISGIVVAMAPAGMDRCLEALRAVPGVEVRQVDTLSHRAVVIQETSSTEEQEEGLRRIQALPGVWHAALVYHWFEDACVEASP